MDDVVACLTNIGSISLVNDVIATTSSLCFYHSSKYFPQSFGKNMTCFIKMHTSLSLEFGVHET